MVLGIYGSGVLGREVLELAKQIQVLTNRWRDIVFIDDVAVDISKNGADLMPFMEFTKLFSADKSEIAIALGEPAHRQKLYSAVKDSGYRLATLIHPTVEIFDSTDVKEGIIICVNSFISSNTTLGNNVCIQPHCQVFHDCILDDHVVMSPSARLAGGVTVGEGAFIGMGAIVKQKINVGKWSIIGIGSLVLHDVDDEDVVVGSPAKKLRTNVSRQVF